jgi:tRNA wybutosine-synthesizing protein 5
MAKIPGYGNVPRSVKMIGIKSEVPIEINPSPEKIEEIVANRKPVLIRGLKIGQCTEKWTAEYLTTKCIESKVSVRISKQPILDFINKNYEFITVTFPEFMDKVFTEQNENSNDRYYFRSIGENPRKDVSDIWRSFPDLATDFDIPEQFSFIKEKIFSSVFRISSKDIRMWTHYDVMDNILCQVVGSKKVVLWEPKEVKHLYVTGSTSKVLDIDNPDLDKFPKFAKANSMECVLEPGDILYIPSCWWHNVITLSPSISINVFYKHLDDEAYTKKDLYGNKDLVQAEKAMEQLDQMISTLKTLPPYYQEFYANYLLSQFKSKTNL